MPWLISAHICKTWHSPRVLRHRLDRIDPDLVLTENAARVTVITVAAFVSLWLVASMADLGMEGAYLGLTVAQYLAWFEPEGPRAERLRVALGGWIAAMTGLLLGMWLGLSPWAAGIAAVPLTALAFAFEARSSGARTAALACPYTLVFTAYYAPQPDELLWLVGAVLAAGLIVLVIRHLLWRESRVPSRAALAREHVGAMQAALRASLRDKRVGNALWRLTERTAGIEARIAAQGSQGARLTRRLTAARARLVDILTGQGGHMSAKPTLNGMLVELGKAEDRTLVPAVPPRRSAQAPRDRLSSALKRAVQVGAALAVAIPLGVWLSPDRWAWAYLAAMLMFYNTGNSDDSIAKGRRRLRGTVAGGIAGLVAAELLNGITGIQVTALIALQFVAVFLGSVSYAWMIAASTALLALFFGVTGYGVPSIVTLRFGETLFGAAAGFLVARLIYPSDSRDRCRAALADLFDRVAAFLEAEEPFATARLPAAALADLQRSVRTMLWMDKRKAGEWERTAEIARCIVHLAECSRLDEKTEAITPPARFQHRLRSFRDTLRDGRSLPADVLERPYEPGGALTQIDRLLARLQTGSL